MYMSLSTKLNKSKKKSTHTASILIRLDKRYKITVSTFSFILPEIGLLEMRG